ncbi:MAG: hypothetical protein WD672_04335, partial [Woeseia sp.]
FALLAERAPDENPVRQNGTAVRRQGLSDEEFDEQAEVRRETEEALKRCLARGQYERLEPALRQLGFTLLPRTL